MKRPGHLSGFCLLLLFASALVSGAGPADEPWDGPAFSAEPGAVLRAAQAVPVPEGEDIIVLFDESKYVFDAEGRAVESRRLVYRTVTEQGAEAWASTSAEWEPWHQGKPEIRARVITADGKAHILDPKTLGEATKQDDEDRVYSDRKILQGPLPAIAAGAVVEEQRVTRDTSPRFDRGAVYRTYVGSKSPTRKSRVIIEAPTGLPLHIETRLLPGVEPQRTESGGRVRVVLEVGPMESIPVAEPYLPPDVPRWPYVSIATGKSWGDVAARYAEVLEQQLRGSDVNAIVAKVIAGKKSREEKAAALMAWLHQEVRYTGVEFGEAGLVPRPPAETLTRKYGDCKDKATLLIALLRAADIPAHLALLTTGPSEDVSPEQPGVGYFDHAIVMVPGAAGAPDAWIDATDEDSRFGEIPLMDQGRMALVVRPGTTALVRTPESTSADNRTLESREFFLSELGPARVVETTEAWGSIENDFRGHFGSGEEKELRKQMEGYAQETYSAKNMESFEHGPRKDFSRPYWIRLEMKKASRGTTGQADAAVGVFLSHMATRLPSYIWEDEESEEEGAAKPKKTKWRTQDLVLQEPHVTEWRYRIVPPPGFRLRELPAAGRVELGPALLTKEFERTANGEIRASFRFDTVKRRFTVAEAESLRKAIRELREQKALLIFFDHIGETHLAEGRMREAFGAFRELIALHPKEALHREQLARAMLAAGLGETARAEARRATELDPTSATAFRTLAWILQHDLVGRLRHKGFDRAAALAAYRKSVELDATEDGPRADLAILLEHDSRGRRYVPGADMKGAITEYRAMEDKLEGMDLGSNLAVALMWTRQFPEMKAAALKIKKEEDRNPLLLIGTALSEGPAAAIRQATELIKDAAARRAALRGAGSSLIQMREYAAGGELQVAGAQGTPDAAAVLSRANVFRTLKRVEDSPLPESDPRRAMRSFFVTILGSESLTEDVLALFTKGSREELLRTEEEFVRSLSPMRAQLRSTGVPMEVLIDVVCSAIQFAVDGDEGTGFRIRMTGPGSPPMSFVVVREDGQYRMLDSPGDATTLGEEIMRRANAGDLPGARRLLDWVREEEALGGGDDPIAGHPFARLWTKGAEGDLETIRLAATSLWALTLKGDPARELLAEASAKATSDAARLNADLALANAFGKLKKYTELLPVARRLAAAHPTSLTAFGYVSSALGGLERWSELEQVIAARLKLLPDDPDALRMQMEAAAYQGQLAPTQEIPARLAALGKIKAQDLNGQAWYALVAGKVDDNVVQVAQRATVMGQNKEAPSLHTLAAIYAEVGKTAEARENVLLAMQLWGQEEPESEAWYVFGRIAEQYGETQAAAAAYARVKAPEEKRALATSTYTLAQSRLAALKSAATR